MTGPLPFGRILVVSAHCDDFELGAGGLLSRAARTGSRVRTLVVAPGSSEMHTGETLRTREAGVKASRAASKALGFIPGCVDFLNYPDCEVPYSRFLIHDIQRALDDFTPDLVITHWLGDSHADHLNVARATITACRHHPCVWSMEPPPGRISTQGRFQGTVYVGFDIEDLHAKFRALGHHHDESRRFGGSDMPTVVGSRARSHGVEAKCYAAELFQAVRMRL